MDVLITALMLVAWWGIGLTGWVYWWIREFDLTTSELSFSAVVAFAGPITWVVGWLICDDSPRRAPRVLIRRRRKE